MEKEQTVVVVTVVLVERCAAKYRSGRLERSSSIGSRSIILFIVVIERRQRRTALAIRRSSQIGRLAVGSASSQPGPAATFTTAQSIRHVAVSLHFNSHAGRRNIQKRLRKQRFSPFLATTFCKRNNGQWLTEILLRLLNCKCLITS